MYLETAYALIALLLLPLATFSVASFIWLIGWAISSQCRAEVFQLKTLWPAHIVLRIKRFKHNLFPQSA